MSNIVAPCSEVPDNFRQFLVPEETKTNDTEKDADKNVKTSKSDANLSSNPLSVSVKTHLFQQLNNSQKKAVKSALQQNLTLIQGPPGTGKTQVASAIVEQFRILNENTKILVSGFSNIAADVLCKRLIEHQMDCLRLGVGSILDEQKYRGVLLRHYGKKEWAKVVEQSAIISCTCVGAANVVLKKKKFDLIIIDESSQCTEMALLTPLRKLKPTGSLVLIGDHKQLPPTIKSVYAKKRGLDTSLFERLINNGRPVEFLDTQYRMHHALTEFSSMEFYNGQLKTAEDLKRHVPKGFPWPVRDYPLCFVHVDGFHEARDMWMSTENDKEAHLIVKIASTLLQQNWRHGRITIITPYRAQRENIEEKLNDLYGRAYKQWFEVCTVDGFQGNESEVIIFSAVRANEMNDVGFLRERARVNVMLTRPRSGLIVVGNIHTLSKEMLWNKWLEHVVIKNKSFLDSRILEQNDLSSNR
ncbi:hypothetical protein RFI_27510 [Reticulomyxa filosa]|uniref:AAA+ ATPase domain-containing protein n=1 Tax=Reticulomyxa filosa TaxID=46433 RepID=X6M8C8_RETFI|nr:hypothetical protein RFI_27510 [Reticulomyxa filosa]|eukprot:ETO09866.1 hypothetical protein RFI_27510 [Reticulomyxa filosa]